VHTGDDRYWQWYDHIWAYCWEHFVDHEHGAWFRILHRDNRNTTREKSNAGKVDYHNMGACFDVLAMLEAESENKTQARCSQSGGKQ
jgi:mannose/cellobiose epimerase-like protein (N-acyl-D-glucosamine 2-epimerase family)